MAVVARKKREFSLGNCLASDEVGDCVRVTGAEVAGRVQVTKVDPTVPDTDQAVGIIVDKIDTTTCIVMLNGMMRDVYTGLVPGKRYWIGSDSKLTDVRPSPDPGVGSYYYLQLMGVAMDDEVLRLDPQLPMVLRGT